MSLDNLRKQGEELFSKRVSLMSLWQHVSEQFYPERADFLVQRNLGQELGKQLLTSYPILARRGLGDAFSSMLRPTSLNWFHTRTQDWDKLSGQSKAWLEFVDVRMRRAMFNKATGFHRATKQGDHDFAAFGQCVIQLSLNREANGLLYRNWHLRDCAWCENEDGMIDTFYRKWKPPAIELLRLFPKSVSQKVRDLAAKSPYTPVEVWHVVLPSGRYEPQRGDKQFRQPFASVYFDATHNELLEEIGQRRFGYVIPRWSTVSGSQYAYSPAVVAALPDARLIQSMTRVMLESGEKAVSPPMIATQNAIRGDIALYAGGVTWVDEAYDERLGEVLRPLTQDQRGLPIGFEMLKDTREMISEAFFLSKLQLPPPGSEMTAFEVGQRVQEYIRQAMPLFDPLESEYNAPLCDETFEILLHHGAFGSVQDIPRELRGQAIEYEFESPLHDATERAKGQRFMEAMSMLGEAINLDPSTRFVVDAPTAFREVLDAIGVPAAWTRDTDEVKKMMQAEQQQQQTSELLANLNQGATAAKTLNEAGLNGTTTVNRNNANTTASGIGAMP